MQQEKETAKETNSKKKCYVNGCLNKVGRMFSIPPLEKDRSRCLRWLEACGRPDLLQLPPRKLQQKTVCERHFEKKYFLWTRLSTSAVPTLHLPAPTSATETRIDETAMEVEEEEGCHSRCTVGSRDDAAPMDYVGSTDNVGSTDSVGSLGNAGWRDNEGSMDNVGSTDNVGSLANVRSMDAGCSVNNVGSLGNTGSMDAACSVDNVGSLSNTGSMDAACSVNNVGSLGNTGSMDAGCSVDNVGSLGNTGSMDAACSVDNVGSLGNTGSMDAACSVDNVGSLGNTGSMDAACSVDNVGSLGNTGSMDAACSVDNVGSLGNEGSMDKAAYEQSKVIPGSSRVNMLKIINSGITEKGLKIQAYNAHAKLIQVGKLCRRRRLALEDRVKKFERLVRLGVCKVIENLPTHVHETIRAQMRNAKRPSRRRRFSYEEKTLALSIYMQSPKAYRYFSESFLLPSARTLIKLLSQIPLRAGICENIFEELKERFEYLIDERLKYAVLHFGTIKLSPSLIYDRSVDTVEGFVDNGFNRKLDIADRATMWLLKGIHGRRPWKQPVAYTFHKGPCTVENIVHTFKELVGRAFQAGIKVVASVCNQGRANCEAIKKLIEHSKRSAFQTLDTSRHDVIVIDGNVIAPLFNPPQLFTCMRNNLLTKDLQFTSKDNVLRLAKWSHVQDIYFIDNSAKEGRKIMRKLTDEHVVPDKIKKYSVKGCAEVFCQMFGALMNLMSSNKMKSVCGTREMPIEGVDTARFIHLMNQTFESVSNTKIPRAKAKSAQCKTPEIWDAGVAAFANMKFVKKNPTDKERPMVLRNWVQTLKNFKFLQNYLFDLYFTDFLGCNFNQSALQHFFRQTRQHGGQIKYPTCSAFHGYYRTFLLHSCSQLVPWNIKLRYKDCAPFLYSLEIISSNAPQTTTNKNDSISFNCNVPSAAESTVQAVSRRVLKSIKKKNVTCERCLATVHDVGDDSSTNAGCKLLISRVVSLCYGNITYIAHIPNLVATVESLISEHVNSTSICPEHANVMRTHIVRECILYVVRDYLKKLKSVK